MKPDAERIRDLFIAALGKVDPADWDAYLQAECAGDPELAREVRLLLDAHLEAGSLLQRPALGLGVTGDRGPAREDATDATAPPPAEAPGTVIGPYKLLQEIGEGGMGTVYLAEQTAPVRRQVALKVIKAGMDSRQVLARFGAERQALALMDHPNIARVLDAGATDQGRPYFVMELVKGLPITRFCDERRLTPRERLELLIPVCQAVQHAHQKGVIHRDLKPSNVLVALYDGQPVPKVIDFGVAKATGPKLTEATLFTGFGAVAGTPEYMSPEQAELNQLDIDTRSDIYSLGVLLYELLTGTTPLDRRRLKQAALMEVLRAIREEEPPRPSTRLSTTEELPSIAACRNIEPRRLAGLVRGELDWIVMKALEKDRNRRYETATGLAADLRRYLDDEPVQAGPPSAAYRLRKLARRHRAALFAGVLVVVAVLVAVGGMAGGVGWAVRDRQTRQAALDREVMRALEDVESWYRRDDLPEALSALKRAEGLLAGGGGSEPTRQAVRSWRTDLDRVEQLEKNLLMWQEQQAARARAVDEGYTRAFAELGIDIDRMGLDDTAARLRPLRIRDHLLLALDNWADNRHNLSSSDPPRKGAAWWQRPMALARAVDPDPFRNRIRSAVERGDWGELDRIASDPGASELPYGSLRLLSREMYFGPIPNGRERALALLKEALSRDPGNFWLNAILSVDVDPELRNRTGEPLRYAQATVALRPRSAGALNNLGIALNVAGRLTEAAAYLRKAVELAPRDVKLYLNMGAVLKDQGKLDEAIAEYRKAIELDPKDPRAYSNLGVALKDRGQTDEAIAYYRKAIELDPKGAKAYSNLGVALKDRGQIDEAIAFYRKAIELESRFAGFHTNLGAALQEHGKLDEAIACHRKAIELDPKYASAHNNLGFALRDQGRVEEAIAEYRKAIELDPKYASAHNNLGEELRLLGMLDEAESEFRKALELDPKSAIAHNGLGIALMVKGQRDKGLAAFRKAIELKPDFAQAHSNLGHALGLLGNPKESEAEYRKVIELDPKSAVAHNNLAWFLVTCSDPAFRDVAKGVKLARKAVELAPNGMHWNTLGVALYRAGDWKAAIEALEKSEKLAPGKDFALNGFFLAMARWRLGEKEAARSLFAKAVAWTERNAPKDEELARFGAEASALINGARPIGGREKPPPPASAPPGPSGGNSSRSK